MSTLAPTRPALNAEVQATIDTAVERLVAEFQPEQIWLFGSYAWGEPTPDSDLDFVVVVPDSDESPRRRVQRAHSCLCELGMSKDAAVQTRAEFDRFIEVPASLAFKITREGTLLYKSKTAPPHAADSSERCTIKERKRELIQLWLKKADASLRIVRLIAGDSGGPLDAAIGHTQHAAERALKAFLAFADTPSQKSDDVSELVRQAIAIEPSFSAVLSVASTVKPYLDKFRYPSQNDPMEPTRAEFDEAFAAAQRIYDFVLSLLPQETHPS
jgi:hypothetical protein